MKTLVEDIIREEVRNVVKEYFGSFVELQNVVKEYFGSFVELQKGPVFQVHAAMTKNGLTKPVLKTKRSKLADMRVGEEVFIKAPRGVSVERWDARWCSARCAMQRKTGYKWRVVRDHDRGGTWVTRTR